MLALGGGVIGDLAGFVAATYMRGNAPHTNSHHPAGPGDSSIGQNRGQTRQAQNQIGVFYQPSAVFSDISVSKRWPQTSFPTACGGYKMRHHRRQNALSGCLSIK